MKTITKRELWRTPGTLARLRPGETALITDSGEASLFVTRAAAPPQLSTRELEALAVGRKKFDGVQVLRRLRE